MLETSITIGLLSTFMILFLSRIGAREWVQTFGPKYISKMFSCDFCLSFWINLFLSVIFYIFVSKNIECFIYPFIAAPLTHKMI